MNYLISNSCFPTPGCAFLPGLFLGSQREEKRRSLIEQNHQGARGKGFAREIHNKARKGGS